MAYQMTITLTDTEYASLIAEATGAGKSVEALLHEKIVPQLPMTIGTMNDEEFALHLYHEGIIMNIPTGEPRSPEEEIEVERIAQKLGNSKPLSEIVIEDRGPKE